MIFQGMQFNPGNIFFAKDLDHSVPQAPLRILQRLLHQLVLSTDDSPDLTPITIAESLTLFAILHQNTLGTKDPTKAIYPVTAKVRRRLNKSEASFLKPSDIARGMGEDLSSLNRKLRNECGLNLGKLIDEHRLELSYEGLRQKQHPIAEVAWEAGFQDPNYFAGWFGRKVGQSPREWRQGL